MSRFFISQSEIEGDTIRIKGEDAVHIKKVLRMEQGDRLIASDGSETEYEVEIKAFEQDSVVTIIRESRKNSTEPPVDIILYQGIPKSDKMDYIIQKCTELGVARIVPVITERTVVKLHSEKDVFTKLKRWQRIAEEAAKQCQRGKVPEVGAPVPFREALSKALESGFAIIPYENEKNTGLKNILANNKGTGTISIMIGPEGGFSDKEAQEASAAGILPVTLGPRILRTETAGIAVITILMYELGDMG